jgi:hypothetical protein
MRRLVVAFVLALFASTLGLFPAPASAQHGMMMNHPRCPRGSHWVPPHRDRRGHWVRGHCSRY